jgi:ketosteroid isomerase-like protein
MGASNRRVVERFYAEMWNGDRLDVAEELFARDCVTHQREDNAWVTYPRGPEAMRAHVAEWKATLSEVRVELLACVAEGDAVAVLAELSGRHTGHPVAGVEPSGGPFRMVWCAVYRLRGGVIVEDRVVLDALGNLQEIGALAPSAELFG